MDLLDEVLSPESALLCIPVIIVDDDDLENDELLDIELSSNDNSVAVTFSRISLTVQNDDGNSFSLYVLHRHRVVQKAIGTLTLHKQIIHTYA